VDTEPVHPIVAIVHRWILLHPFLYEKGNAHHEGMPKEKQEECTISDRRLHGQFASSTAAMQAPWKKNR
jgi:hypothetical protein